MTYPYTDDEITEIANEIAEMFFSVVTDSRNDGWYFFNGFSDPKIMWEAFCAHAERNSSITKERGMMKEMLSREQIAIVSAAIKRAPPQVAGY